MTTAEISSRSAQQLNKLFVLTGFCWVSRSTVISFKISKAETKREPPRLSDNGWCADLPLDHMHVLAYQVTYNPLKFIFFFDFGCKEVLKANGNKSSTLKKKIPIENG